MTEIKRIIITLQKEDHAKVKTFCSSIGITIQEAGIAAINEYLKKRNVAAKVETPKRLNSS